MSEPTWSVVFERRADKDISRLDPPVRQRVATAIERLAANPDDTVGLRKLTGRPGWRLRVGDWRVLFHLDRATRTIVIVRVLPRGRAYER